MKIIVIDAGHGMSTPGKRCLKSIDPNETREFYLNDRVADRVEAKLREYECIVIRSDDTTGLKDISLGNRVKIANNAKADVFLSIHHNAGVGGRSGGGTVGHYSSDSLLRLQACSRLVSSVEVCTQLPTNRSSKVVKSGFYVIRKTNMPAFLLENGYMDSTTDTPIILTAEHAEKTADGIVKFLVDYLLLTSHNAVTPITVTPAESNMFYAKYTGKTTTLTAALTTLGINSTFVFRKKIAVANGIKLYTGTYAQNTQIYNLLVAGCLKKG